MKKVFVAYVLIFSVVTMISCGDAGLYEKNKPISGHNWGANQPVRDSFRIDDTSSSYHLYVIFRHTDAYKYNNIWMGVEMKGPEGFQQSDKFDFNLGNDAQGWEGTGMNDIWEVRKRITVLPYRFHHIGTYRYSISQIMRDDPLKHVMSVGLRVEKLR